MTILEPDFEIYKQPGYTEKDIKKFIEKCARLAYKSEDRITDDSYEKFVQMLIDKNHDRPLEFGTVHLVMDVGSYYTLVINLVDIDHFSSLWMRANIVDNSAYITTNYRYYMDIIKWTEMYGWSVDVRKCFADYDNPYFIQRHTVKFIVSRAIADEFRTHVGFSHLAESTRYCNYSKDKFDNEISVIKPQHVHTSPTTVDDNSILWSQSMFQSERNYMNLLRAGWTPQQARGVLQFDIKTELLVCGFGSEWMNFFYRRTAPDAHPDAQYIANKVCEVLEV